MVLKKLSPTLKAVSRQPRAKLPKRWNEATCVLAFFAIAAAKRISEKNAAFSAHYSGQNHHV
jgi:hypothetical protein